MSILSRQAIAAGLREAGRIKNGYMPTKADLTDAPILSNWMIEPLRGGVYRLVGTVSSHPSIRDGWCTTSPMLAIDPLGTWVRTVSRYYRLGPVMGDQVLRDLDAKKRDHVICEGVNDDASA